MPVMCGQTKFDQSTDRKLTDRKVNFHLNTAYLTYRLTNQSLAQYAKIDRIYMLECDICVIGVKESVCALGGNNFKTLIQFFYAFFYVSHD